MQVIGLKRMKEQVVNRKKRKLTTRSNLIEFHEQFSLGADCPNEDEAQQKTTGCASIHDDNITDTPISAETIVDNVEKEKVHHILKHLWKDEEAKSTTKVISEGRMLLTQSERYKYESKDQLTDLIRYYSTRLRQLHDVEVPLLGVGDISNQNGYDEGKETNKINKNACGIEDFMSRFIAHGEDNKEYFIRDLLERRVFQGVFRTRKISALKANCEIAEGKIREYRAEIEKRAIIEKVKENVARANKLKTIKDEPLLKTWVRMAVALLREKGEINEETFLKELEYLQSSYKLFSPIETSITDEKAEHKARNDNAEQKKWIRSEEKTQLITVPKSIHDADPILRSQRVIQLIENIEGFYKDDGVPCRHFNRIAYFVDQCFAAIQCIIDPRYLFVRKEIGVYRNKFRDALQRNREAICENMNILFDVLMVLTNGRENELRYLVRTLEKDANKFESVQKYLQPNNFRVKNSTTFRAYFNDDFGKRFYFGGNKNRFGVIECKRI
ncbi:hypothetical protein ACOME3_008094 [Neoechinorhynchus agilis]